MAMRARHAYRCKQAMKAIIFVVTNDKLAPQDDTIFVPVVKLVHSNAFLFFFTD